MAKYRLAEKYIDANTRRFIVQKSALLPIDAPRISKFMWSYLPPPILWGWETIYEGAHLLDAKVFFDKIKAGKIDSNGLTILEEI